MWRSAWFRAGPAILAGVLASGLWACGGGATSTGGAPAKAAGSAAAAAAAPTMTVDGKSVVFQGAIATGLGGHVVEIELASHELACSHAAEVHAPGDADKHLVLTLAPVLAPDGTSRWHIISTFFDEASRVDDGGAVEVSGDPDHGVDVVLPALSLDGGSESPSKLGFAGGAVHAAGCRTTSMYMFTGDDQTAPAARPQNDLVFSVAGVAQHVQSALLIRHKDDAQLVLTTGAQSCTASTDTPDLSYALVLDASGHPTGAVLSGAIFDKQRAQSFDGATAAPRVTLGKPAGGQIPVGIAGAYPHQGYAVKLGGSVQALVCDRP